MDGYRFIARIEELLRDNNIVGAAVSVTDDKKIIFERGFGLSDSESERPVLPTSLFRIASITKVFTGSVIMRLVEEGRLDLDTPIKRYVDWLELSDSRAKDTVTLRHLLSHTSGLPKEYTPEGPLDESLSGAILRESLPTLKLESLPGENVYLYSNWGVRLAAQVVTEVTGEKFSSLAERYVIEPLGMKNTFFFLPDDRRSDLSYPHTVDDGRISVSHYIKENYTRLAVGGLYSDVRDLSRLARMLISGGLNDEGERVIESQSLLEMQRELAELPSGDRYGLTLQMHVTPGGVYTVGHYGNAMPYTSALFVARDYPIGVAVHLNTHHPTLRREISDLVIDELTGR